MSEEKKKKHVPPPRPKNDSLKADPHPGTHVGRLIAVVSGKGGVGKSSVTAMSAVWARRQGYQTAILDADVTGPSMPRMFGLSYADLRADEEGNMHPAETVTGIKVMSMNLMMKQEDAPVIWRGPVISGVLKQFWSEVVWGNVDYMFVDMPPGTGDVPLTVFQSLPVDGIIVVTTPQDLVSMIVGKAVGMARLMNVPILGMIENMSYVTCPHCGEPIYLFGQGRAEAIAEREGVPLIARIPMDPALTAACDNGQAEYAECAFLDGLADILPPLS